MSRNISESAFEAAIEAALIGSSGARPAPRSIARLWHGGLCARRLSQAEQRRLRPRPLPHRRRSAGLHPGHPARHLESAHPALRRPDARALPHPSQPRDHAPGHAGRAAQGRQGRRLQIRSGLFPPGQRPQRREPAQISRPTNFPSCASFTTASRTKTAWIWPSFSTACPSSPPNSRTISPARPSAKPSNSTSGTATHASRCCRPAAVWPISRSTPIWSTSPPSWIANSTRFLPFNQGKFGGAGNPPVPPTQTGKYPTSYLWDEIWCSRQRAQPDPPVRPRSAR